MLYYPQLTTGSITQYPISRMNSRRSVINSLADGTRITVSDDPAASVAWTLSYAHLTSAELTGIQRFFETVYGRWQTFTFMDPTGNLLNWSEDLTQPVWTVDPLLNVTGGNPDPSGGSSAAQLINTAQTAQAIAQTLSAPSSYHYCFSLFARGSQPCLCEMFANTGQLAFTTTSGWQRLVYSFGAGPPGASLTVGIRIPAGCEVDVFGLQIEAQAGAGGYKKTRDRAGIYPATRFDQDLLSAVATGVNQYSTTVRIISNVAG